MVNYRNFNYSRLFVNSREMICDYLRITEICDYSRVVIDFFEYRIFYLTRLIVGSNLESRLTEREENQEMVNSQSNLHCPKE